MYTALPEFLSDDALTVLARECAARIYRVSLAFARYRGCYSLSNHLHAIRDSLQASAGDKNRVKVDSTYSSLIAAPAEERPLGTRP